MEVKDIIVQMQNPTESDKELIISAYEFAKNAHRDHLRYSGEPYLNHLTEVGKKLAEMGMGARTIAAGLLHDTIEDTAATSEEIREKFAGVTVDVLFLEQPDMFLLSRDLDPKSLGNMAKLMGVENFSVRELSGQSREVLELLHTYCDRTEERIQTPQYPVAEYPEIDSLKEMFATDSMQRGCRQPLHVLLVEDDPLTVRMVSSLISGNHKPVY